MAQFSDEKLSWLHGMMQFIDKSSMKYNTLFGEGLLNH